MSKSNPESLIQTKICEYLTKKGHFFYRVNNGAIFDPKTNRFRKKSKYTPKGIPDIFLLKDGISHFIEVKTATGKQSREQRVFQITVEAHGGKYHLARSKNDIIATGL